MKRGEIVQVVVAFGVVGLRRVDKEQAGSPEADSEVVQVVVAFGVVGLRRVDKEQSQLSETAQTFWSCLKALTFWSCLKARTFWSK